MSVDVAYKTRWLPKTYCRISRFPAIFANASAELSVSTDPHFTFRNDEPICGKRSRLQVINLSLGGGGRSKVMEQAVDYARRHGTTVICAAGNNGRYVESPANAPGADAMPLIDEWIEGGLDEAVKRFESRLLERLYPTFPSTRQLAKRLGVSHTAIANKLREYGIGKK